MEHPRERLQTGLIQADLLALPGGVALLLVVSMQSWKRSDSGGLLQSQVPTHGNGSWTTAATALSTETISTSCSSIGFSARCVIDYTDECGVLNGDNSLCTD